MDKEVAREILLLEQAISTVMHRSRKLASKVDSSNHIEVELLENLRQNAAAFHYNLEALKNKIC